MTKNPPGFDIDQFSPAPEYREAYWDDIVDSVSGPPPRGVRVYDFPNRVFIEIDPYRDGD